MTCQVSGFGLRSAGGEEDWSLIGEDPFCRLPPPGLLMNLLSLSRITKQTPCELDYEEAQIGFVLCITGEHKLVFTLLSNFYLCNMATSVFRSEEAKDAVKLFTLSYLTSAVWMPVVVLDLVDLDLVVLDLAVLDLAVLEFMLWIWTIVTIC